MSALKLSKEVTARILDSFAPMGLYALGGFVEALFTTAKRPLKIRETAKRNVSLEIHADSF